MLHHSNKKNCLLVSQYVIFSLNLSCPTLAKRTQFCTKWDSVPVYINVSHFSKRKYVHLITAETQHNIPIKHLVSPSTERRCHEY